VHVELERDGVHFIQLQGEEQGSRHHLEDAHGVRLEVAPTRQQRAQQNQAHPDLRPDGVVLVVATPLVHQQNEHGLRTPEHHLERDAQVHQSQHRQVDVQERQHRQLHRPLHQRLVRESQPDIHQGRPAHRLQEGVAQQSHRKLHEQQEGNVVELLTGNHVLIQEH